MSEPNSATVRQMRFIDALATELGWGAEKSARDERLRTFAWSHGLSLALLSRDTAMELITALQDEKTRLGIPA